ncbi:MAG TPA: hypothetical protein VMA74_02470 [Dyella sp.]|uniref:hypothetical protein n=1 Tax=Dyella sp. TaxID=1869338 RepID=UPI002B58E0FB|nr:hypothetical protein [Dyella sp.]HUB88573.1 hypothetical protein [Dyella sp.]
MSYERIDGYHDVALKGIVGSGAPGIIALSFVMEDGQQKSLTLHACEIFRATDFVNQNVVSRLLLFRGPEIDTGIVIDKLRWATSLSDAKSYLSPEWVEVVLAKIRSGQLSLLVLEPSCGAEIVALFSHLST